MARKDVGRIKDPGAYSGGRYKKLLPHRRTSPWRSWSLRLSLLGCIIWAVTWPTLRLRFTLCSVDWLEVLLKVRDHQLRLGVIPSIWYSRQEHSSRIHVHSQPGRCKTYLNVFGRVRYQLTHAMLLHGQSNGFDGSTQAYVPSWPVCCTLQRNHLGSQSRQCRTSNHRCLRSRLRCSEDHWMSF